MSQGGRENPRREFLPPSSVIGIEFDDREGETDATSSLQLVRTDFRGEEKLWETRYRIGIRNEGHYDGGDLP